MYCIRRIVSNESVYREIDPIKEEKNLLFRSHHAIASKQSFTTTSDEKCGKEDRKRWIQEIQWDLKAVGLRMWNADIKVKISILLKTHKFTAEVARRGAVEISRVKKLRLERIKGYWGDRKNQTSQPSKKNCTWNDSHLEGDTQRKRRLRNCVCRPLKCLMK